MARPEPRRAWRPDAAKPAPQGALGAWVAFLFNFCGLLLPLAAAAAFTLIARDQLYAYDFTDSNARGVRAGVERQAGELILLDFDRRRQWDDLVAMELVEGDVAAARGFLLSARAMLSPRDASELGRAMRADAPDAEIELAALGLLTPGTRSRYESAVPLLSRRSASGAAMQRAPERFEMLGDARDFELLAGALLADSDSDSMHFTLTGLGLQLGGEFTPRMAAGASALIAASRRDDYPDRFGAEVNAMLASAVSANAFRGEAARLVAENADPASFPISAPAFRASVDAERVAAVKVMLDEIGQMSEAATPTGAMMLLSHARSLRDVPRLRLVAQAAGDRAAAVAKRAPRDGALPRAARGVLTYNNQLTMVMVGVVLAIAGLVLSTIAAAAAAIERIWRRLRGHVDGNARKGGDLVQNFDTPWRAL